MTRFKLTGSIALLASLILASCTGSSAEQEAATQQSLTRINQITTAAAASFNTMLRSEKTGAGAPAPQRSELDMFWMAMQSTTRDLERLDKMLADNPDLLPEAKNYWNGRVQEGASKVESMGLLVKRDNPTTSKLGEIYGEDRVTKETTRLFNVVHAIQDKLGISWTPYTPSPPSTP